MVQANTVLHGNFYLSGVCDVLLMNIILPITILASFFFYYKLHTFCTYDFGYNRQYAVSQFLTEEHPYIILTEKSGNLNYHIKPYKNVSFSLPGGLLWEFAPYTSSYVVNESYTVMSFVEMFPKNIENVNCFDSKVDNRFNLNIICDPLEKFHLENVIQKDECTYEANLFTEAGCQFWFSNKLEL